MYGPSIIKLSVLAVWLKYTLQEKNHRDRIDRFAKTGEVSRWVN